MSNERAEAHPDVPFEGTTPGLPTPAEVLGAWVTGIMDCFLYGGMHALEGRKAEAAVARDGTWILIQFGVRAKLITPAEGNDWLDAFFGRQPWGRVLVKWHPDTDDSTNDTKGTP